jgi:hypothetical protein
MATESKQIVEYAMNGEKALSLSRRLKPPHLAFALAGWLV